VVAPYEADSQLVYLERQGLISGIVSEDSDLLVFGAKRLLTKMDQHGQCIEINRRDFCAVREISLTDWTDREFRHMAILSGCDYLDGVNNVGLKTAYRLIRKHKTPSGFRTSRAHLFAPACLLSKKAGYCSLDGPGAVG
jgi:exonuclease-1